MTVLVKRLLFFSLPIILFFVLIELFILFYPNKFSLKASYLKANFDIELLMLGSSHVDNDINPEYLEVKSANLAYGNQDIQLDSALFFTYIKNLHKLKFLILELDYHTLEERNSKKYFRLPWYYRYHDIKLYPISILNKNLLYSSSPNFFNNYILQIINPLSHKYKLNKYGSLENDYQGIFMTMSYNIDKINSSATVRLKDRFSNVSTENYIFNSKKMINIIDYCLTKNIKVILLMTPAYDTYRNTFKSEKLNRRENFIESVICSGQNKLFVLNYESDNRFTVKDFKDDDHLNSSGAKKFTKMINEEIKSLN